MKKNWKKELLHQYEEEMHFESHLQEVESHLTFIKPKESFWMQNRKWLIPASIAFCAVMISLPLGLITESNSVKGGDGPDAVGNEVMGDQSYGEAAGTSFDKDAPISISLDFTRQGSDGNTYQLTFEYRKDLFSLSVTSNPKLKYEALFVYDSDIECEREENRYQLPTSSSHSITYLYRLDEVEVFQGSFSF